MEDARLQEQRKSRGGEGRGRFGSRRTAPPHARCAVGGCERDGQCGSKIGEQQSRTVCCGRQGSKQERLIQGSNTGQSVGAAPRRAAASASTPGAARPSHSQRGGRRPRGALRASVPAARQAHSQRRWGRSTGGDASKAAAPAARSSHRGRRAAARGAGRWSSLEAKKADHGCRREGGWRRRGQRAKWLAALVEAPAGLCRRRPRTRHQAPCVQPRPPKEPPCRAAPAAKRASPRQHPPVMLSWEPRA